MYTETFDRSIEDKQENTFSENTDDRRSSGNSNPEVIDGIGSISGLESQIDVITRDENGENNDSDIHSNGIKSVSISTIASSSSSSSESSTGEYFRVEDSFKFTTSSASSLASKSGKDDVSSGESSAKSEVDNSPTVPTPTFRVYDTFGQKGMSPTASPPIQVMDRSGIYDPARIPSSVFERNTNNPMEWSLASNDSLFSIQLGQNSFSRDAFLMFGEPAVSEEMTKSDELNKLNREPSLVMEEIDTVRKSVDAENHQQTTETLHESFKIEERLSEDKNEVKTLRQTASSKSSKSIASILSRGSGASVHSLALPLKKRSRSLCYCFHCSHCCYECPTSCHTWWPSCTCSNCGWAFSSCWNCSCSKCCVCDRGSPILTERNDSLRTDVPRQQSYKEESEVTSNSTTSNCSCFQSCCNWFHCFSCHSCTWKLSCKCCS